VSAKLYAATADRFLSFVDDMKGPRRWIVTTLSSLALFTVPLALTLCLHVFLPLDTMVGMLLKTGSILGLPIVILTCTFLVSAVCKVVNV
jgi:hypothetical protein